MKLGSWTEEHTRLLAEMAPTGAGLTEISRAVGYSINAVRRRARLAGITVMPRVVRGGTPRVADWDRAKQLAASGVHEAAAARVLGIHHTTAMYIARKSGFTWPKPQEGSAAPRRLHRKKPAQPKPLAVSDESPELVEKLMRLVGL